MGNGSSSTSKGTLTSAFLTSQHGPSFVSSLLTKKGAEVLPDGTVLTVANVAELYQHYTDLYNLPDTRSRAVVKARDTCHQFLASHLAEVLGTDARRTIFAFSEAALQHLLTSDDLNVGEFVLFVVVGVWADRQISLAAGEEWSFPDVAPAKSDTNGDENTNDNTNAHNEGDDEENNALGDLELPDVPDWKFGPDYATRMREAMAPLLTCIRFPIMSTPQLLALDDDPSALVPRAYIAEAIRHRALQGSDVYKMDASNPRFRHRRCTTDAVWDTKRHGQHIAVSSDGKTVNKTQSYWYSVAVAKEGYTSGRHSWAIKVSGDEAYIGIARKEISQMDNYLGVDTFSWAYNYTAYLSTGDTSTGSGRSFGETFARGDVIGVVLDLIEMKLIYYKNGKRLGEAFTNLPRVPLYPAVGWRDGSMTFVSVHVDDM